MFNLLMKDLKLGVNPMFFCISFCDGRFDAHSGLAVFSCGYVLFLGIGTEFVRPI